MPSNRVQDVEALGEPPMIATRVVGAYDQISPAQRREILAQAPAPDLHARLLAEVPLFDRVEVGESHRPAPPPSALASVCHVHARPMPAKVPQSRNPATKK